MSNKPAFRAYAPQHREGYNDWWHPVGVAWNTKSGVGYVITLETLPIPIDEQCKIVLRPYKEHESSYGIRDPEGNLYA